MDSEIVLLVQTDLYASKVGDAGPFIAHLEPVVVAAAL